MALPEKVALPEKAVALPKKVALPAKAALPQRAYPGKLPPGAKPKVPLVKPTRKQPIVVDKAEVAQCAHIPFLMVKLSKHIGCLLRLKAVQESFHGTITF